LESQDRGCLPAIASRSGEAGGKAAPTGKYLLSASFQIRNPQFEIRNLRTASCLLPNDLSTNASIHKDLEKYGMFYPAVNYVRLVHPFIHSLNGIFHLGNHASSKDSLLNKLGSLSCVQT
jgi:hypothetical protein